MFVLNSIDREVINTAIIIKVPWVIVTLRVPHSISFIIKNIKLLSLRLQL